MKRSNHRIFFFTLLLLAAGIASVTFNSRLARQSAVAAKEAPAAKPAEQALLKESLGKMPLYFVENKGQLDNRVSYYVQGRDKSLFFTPKGITFALSNTTPNQSAQRWNLRLDFVGANRNVNIVGKDEAEAVFSYFTGTPDQWKAGLKTYKSIVYENLWPGIDLVYSGTVNQVKYEFIVQPGANPNQIKLAYRGASSVKLNAAGSLEVATPVAGFNDDKPVSFQDVDGEQVEIATTYALEKKSNTYGFRVSKYDRSKPLVIDPVMIMYCGYIGGSGDDTAASVAVTNDGYAYIGGDTSSDEKSFPVVMGPDLTFNGKVDAFAAKVKQDGSGLIFCGYIGGEKLDNATGIGLDSVGNAYLAGTTGSDQKTFPVKQGPDLSYNGNGDAFVAKVGWDSALIYCGYIGGAGDDYAWGIATNKIFPNSDAYVVGRTDSTEAMGFPLKNGPDLTFNGNGPPLGQDAFVAKVSKP